MAEIVFPDECNARCPFECGIIIASVHSLVNHNQESGVLYSSNLDHGMLVLINKGYTQKRNLQTYQGE